MGDLTVGADAHRLERFIAWAVVAEKTQAEPLTADVEVKPAVRGEAVPVDDFEVNAASISRPTSSQVRLIRLRNLIKIVVNDFSSSLRFGSRLAS